ncbi:MAG: translation initiation factor IF-2 [Chloroflexi bacterium]|jgi:translation initiation factor IF-2|nr:MAG: translation initiation factor IF-2 [Chloroflexota bacterium]
MTKQRKSARPPRPERAPLEPRAERPAQVHDGILELPSTIIVSDLATLLKVNPADIINPLIRSGVFATMNQGIDRETAALIATELGFTVAEPEPEAVESEPAEPVKTQPAAAKTVFFEERVGAKLVARAPIVTVMGHVDHGKTSLLDALRKTSVAAGERGGITQHLGASEVRRGDRSVLFLDTPGHEAFTAMRARGARVTDIAVIVVAADDGVMPQTREAISHARAANVPIIIAMNKIDKPDANPERVKSELAESNVVVEAYGGDVPMVAVSAKSGEGLDELLDMVLLVADLGDYTADPDRAAVGTVIEAQRDKGRGPIATVIVQTGTLHVGDAVVAGGVSGKVRSLESTDGKRIKSAGPSTAAILSGLPEVPASGEIFRVAPDERAAREMAEQARNEATAGREGRGHASMEDLYQRIQSGGGKEVRVILKSDVAGSLGAIEHQLEKIQSDEVRINVLLSAAGEVTENDILLASASDAIVLGFTTSVTPGARRMAETEKVDVRLYEIIYELADDMKAAIEGMLDPEKSEVIEGRAEVKQIFPGKGIIIAGCVVREGRVTRGAKVRLFRGGNLVATDVIESLRRFRDDVREVKEGQECGIGIGEGIVVQEGDMLEIVGEQSTRRKL